MKKVLLTLTAVLTLAAIVISCNKPDNPKPGPGPDGGDGGEEAEEIIAIDGEFADWNGLSNVSVAVVPDDEEAYPCLIKMKAVADKVNVYLYFEFQAAEDQTKSPMTIMFDSDDDLETGFTDYHWANAGWDFGLETSNGFMSGTSYKRITDYKLLKPKEGQDGQPRNWDTKNYTEGTAKGVKNQGTLDKDLYKFEIKVPRELLKIEKKGTIRVSAYVSDPDNNWAEVGVLPIDDGLGMTEMLEVAIP
jgi:hypothetical protein